MLTVLRDREIQRPRATLSRWPQCARPPGRIRDMDKAAAAEHPGDEHYADVVDEDEDELRELGAVEPEEDA